MRMLVCFFAAVVFLFGSVSNSAFNTVQYSNNFDPNSDGGNWTCFRSLASGTCGAGPFLQYLDATCDGVTSDNTALGSWLTYAHGLGDALAKLYIPSGSNCILNGSNGNSFATNTSINCVGYNGNVDTHIKNLLVWGYGASVTNHWFGGQGFWTVRNPNGAITNCANAPTNTSPLIQSVSSGTASVTLVTAAENSNFVVGDWIVVTGLAIQTDGFPPNTFYHEFAKITAINSGVLSLDRTLQNSYLSTWPDISPGTTSPWRGGPAAVYLMNKTYDVVATYKGLIVLGASQTNIIGKRIVLQGVVWATVGTNGPNPTQSERIEFIGGYFPSTEVDKMVDTLLYTGVRGNNVTVQSSSINNFIISNSVFSGGLGGTTRTMSILNSSFSAIRAGPTCCGRALSLSLSGVTFTTPTNELHFSNISSYAFSAGTLAISKADAEWASGKGPGLWVPGTKYFMGDFDGENTCTPANTFTVSAVVDAGANVQIVTDIANIPVANLCASGLRPPSTFGAYQSMTLSVTNSGPGNLLSNPEMLPP